MIELIVVMALIALNGFFAMSEMALVTSRLPRLRQMAETSRGARAAVKLAEHPDNLLSTVQIGITLIGVLTGLLGGEAIGLLVADWIDDVVPAAAEYARPIGLGTAVGLITAGSVIFGELIPKRLALTNAETIASMVALPLEFLATAAKPVVWLLGAINRGVLRLLGIRDDERGAISEEEIRMLVSEGHAQGVIDADERNMMHRVMALGDRQAESLMTPRTRIAWLDAAETLDENLATMRETPFSRYPVYRGSDAEVVGILEVKSLIDRLRTGDFDLFEQLREPLFVSESTPAMKLVEILREEQQSLALVVDEYGDVTGIISVNDVLEAVIGRTSSGEGADAHPLVVERDDGSLLVDGALGADSLRELLDGKALPDGDDRDYNTAAGMTIAHFGRIPSVGEHFEWAGWRIEVVDLDGPRIDKLLLQRIDAASVGDG
ncbi:MULTISPECIES: hemolysin family protein [unclassified Luteimonas]|uniref:hemolysin family protein n=1 Tax=unclassified Luteimonas TaxID=2629088 RepID=UPI0018F0928F|nr:MULTISPECIES: hemolysin family protein [unclassified Luteimonas]MBJ6978020.1 HlyC/CorC family transporter [Luteimonas sp. MC1895]MBJ6984840.1 HlyC/CorC family transporter [Luteimonas sp. MC1750]QQO07066.1 HlyC/CorC family transporter [Luteimonas sp. MC1750]